MPVKDNELTKYEGWALGLENLSREEEIQPGSSRSRDGRNRGQLRVATNVDIGNDGRISRRRGYDRQEALPSLHSLWSRDGQFPLMLAVYNGYLVCWNSTLQRSNVVALAAPSREMSYDLHGGFVYYTNGTDKGRVDSLGVRTSWAVPCPSGQPILAAAAAGGLAAGNYQVAITYLDADGRESGSTMAEEVTLTEGQGVALSAIPQPPSGQGVTLIRVYMTACNGMTPYYVRDLAVGMTTATLGVHVPGKALETQFLDELPAGQLVRFHNGRMYVFVDRVMFWSEALMPGLGNLASNYLSFNAAGDMLAGVGVGTDAAGIFVGAGNRIYYLGGEDPKSWRKQVAHPHGAVPGSQVEVDGLSLGRQEAGLVQYWLGTDGQFVLGLPGGQVQALHAERFVAPINVERATAALVERQGLRQMLTILKGGSTSGFAVTDRAEAEVWKNGVRVG
jgi:hypothetical protein